MKRIHRTVSLATALALFGGVAVPSLQAQNELPVSKRVVTGTVTVAANGVTLIGVNGTNVTLGDVLGTQQGSFLGGNFGGSSTVADIVIYFTGGSAKRAYYETNAGTGATGWKDETAVFGPTVEGDVLDPNTAVAILRASSSAAPFNLTSYSTDVAVGTASSINIPAGLSVLVWPRSVEVSLDDTGLDAIFAPGNFGQTPSTDIVKIDTDGDGALEQYYYEGNAATGSVGWKNTTNPFSAPLGATVTINPFQGFLIERQGSATTLNVD